MDTAVTVATISAAAAGVSAFLAYRSSSKATDVNEQASVVGWAKEVRADAAEARRETKEARADVRELSRELTEVRDAFDELVAYARRVIRSIHEPGMEIDRLRQMVPPELPAPRGHNGSAR